MMVFEPKRCNVKKILPATNAEFRQILKQAWNIARKNFGNSLHCYAPSLIKYVTQYYNTDNDRAFVGISVTGSACSLQCDHCKGKILESMIPAVTPEQLYETCKWLHSRGGVGCLISGGSTKQGEVPLKRFIDAIKSVKDDFDLVIAIHTGLVSEELAKSLSRAHIDAVLLDVIGSQETVHDVYHLNRKVEDFEKSMKILRSQNIPVIPHVVVGLHYGELRGEIQALKMIARQDPSAVIIVSLMPLAGTPMELTIPPTPLDIGKVVATARLIMPDKPLILGCARSKGINRVRTDVLAIAAGISGIAYPTDEAIRYAKRRGLDVDFSPYCCSLMHKLFSS